MQKLEEAGQDPNQVEDSEMTEDVDWLDFVVVEQIELYDDKEMTEQMQAAQANAEMEAKQRNAAI